MKREAEAGFTLLEMLVALTLIAVIATGMIPAASHGLRNAAILEDRILGLWVSENRLTEIQGRHEWPDVGTTMAKDSMAGREWNLTLTVAETDDPDLRRIEIKSETRGSFSAARLVGYVGKY